MHDDLAKRRAQMPEGTNRILSARSLASDHRRLYQLLEPGQAVLDAGCGNGAITVGILERVIPGGRVVGVDVNPRLIDEANRRYGETRASRFAPATSMTWSFGRSSTSSPAPGCSSGFRVPGPRWIPSSGPPFRAGGCLCSTTTTRRPLGSRNRRQRSAGFTRPFSPGAGRWGWTTPSPTAWSTCLRRRGCWTWPPRRQHETVRRGEPDFERRISIWIDVIEGRAGRWCATGPSRKRSGQRPRRSMPPGSGTRPRRKRCTSSPWRGQSRRRLDPKPCRCGSCRKRQEEAGLWTMIHSP